MSETKHTPGPWKANFVISGAAYIFGGDRNFARVFNEWQDEANREANARLIAAAPELLEALEAVEIAATMGFASAEILRHDSAIRKGIRAAIAKAKGEQP